MSASVVVPKTAVHENYFAPRNKDNVGFTGKSLDMKGITVAHRGTVF